MKYFCQINNPPYMRPVLPLFYFLIFCGFTFCILGCQKHNEQDSKSIESTNKLEPLDYFYAQRSFPFNRIDLPAYRNAIQQRQSSTILRSSDPAYQGTWLLKGPSNIGGRITDIEMPIDQQNIIYAGSASGGIFKSTDQGENFSPIFDEAKSLSIGDLEISRSNPSVIYAGTGEANAGGGSLAYDGYGIYKSSDAGKTWESKGLTQAGSIGKVALSHQDQQIAYVAAMGALFSNTGQRGVFKTEDGGGTWTQSLFLNDSTGAIDLAIHPENHNIVYAATWERIRRPHRRKYGGLGSGIYKTIDGGQTWIELGEGLPKQANQKGRIGLAISPSNPNTIYAYILNQIGFIQGIYKSEDAGASWLANPISGLSNVSFGWWFGKIAVDPFDANQLYVTSLYMYRSGQQLSDWQEIFKGAHVDHHALFAHPQNPNLVINGNDGGIYISQNKGKDHTKVQDLPNNQFYTCTIDPHFPDRIYGGMQDNGTYRSGIRSDDPWEYLYGGDGFQIDIDPQDSRIFYVQSQYGNIGRTTNDGQSFQSIGIGGTNNWNTPLSIDPHNPQTIYTGNQILYRSDNRGETWRPISRRLVNPDNPTGNLPFGTITCIEVSAINPEVIYVGTDDGNIWQTSNAGSSWEDISQDIPQRWITSIYSSRETPGRVYLTVSGFRFGSSSSQVFKSDNYGKEWIAIGNDLPDIPLNDIIEDEGYPERLLLASDIGVFYSLNEGENWALLGTDLPLAPVTDIDLHAPTGTIVAATYGRSLYSYVLPGIASSIRSSINKTDIQVFPNPTYDRIQVNIPIDDPNLTVRIINMKGQLERQFLVNGETGSWSLSLQGLERGAYIIQVNSSKRETWIKKIVKL